MFHTQDIKNISQIAQGMQGKPEDQVIQELAEMIRRGDGGLTPQKAEQMFQMLMPMLTNEQKLKIKKLLKEL
jgi:ribosome recycling factor